MAPGNPPRHSKSTDEPVTIDLDAQEIASEESASKDAQHNADEVAEAQSETSESIVPDDGMDESEAAKAKADAPIEETVEPFAYDKAPDPELPPYNHAPEPVQPAKSEPPRQPGGTSGLIAAGIVGGLIALIGAGAIQYEGFLPGSSAPETASPEIANLSGEIDGLKQSVANLAAAPQAAPANDALESRIAALETAAKAPQAAGSGTDSATVDALNQKISDLNAQLDQLRGAVSQATEQRATNGAELEQRLTAAEQKLNEPRQDVAVAKAIAAAGLKAAIDRGGPFVAELDTYAGVSPDDPVVADLKNFAETGVPSRAELIRQAPDVATAIVGSVNKADPNESWSDRLMAGAKSLVSVRPVGNIEGESVEAIAARMEDKVKNGDLPGAANEWTTLPTDAKQASAAFKQSLDARIRVEELVGSALSKAVSGTGKEG
ncbi:MULTISPECIES: COG4223 family protein [unclassified Rhizobium]|uniref:COG4223 family protein n=1 Tax=unclassified Rhizobium TaxID=2613769 RepID=UPI001ADBA84E|nr:MULTISPECIES: COG4223 family protein [unclassified Rhizobium]MBO9125994.1 COG4223 family protein [Rhizobium sp. 16-488-2b]MBO9176578.1 COG4223 family protein [Rhizobium sp. 16-488-2a]